MRVSGVVRTAVLLCAAAASTTLSTFAGRGPSQQNNGTLENVLKQLDTQAADFHSLTADLERTKVTVVVNDKSTESGKILVRRDDKMRIELTQPDPRTILRDGDDFYIYNPKIHRVEEYNLGKKKSLVDQFLLLGFGTPGSDLKKSIPSPCKAKRHSTTGKWYCWSCCQNRTTCETSCRRSSYGSTNPPGFRRSRNFLN